LKDRLTVALIGAPSGLGGYLRLLSHSGEYGHLKALKVVTLVRDDERKTATVEGFRLVDGGALIKFAGADDMEKAKAFSSWEIEVPREEACPLSEGEFYVSDLCQCSMLFGGEAVGTVRSVCESGASDLLEVETVDGKMVLVPFVGRLIGAVDLDARTVELLERWPVE
jgi:16S rRNA processing protein RimM